MSFTNFYINRGGSGIYSGSTIAPPTVTMTGGSWVNNGYTNLVYNCLDIYNPIATGINIGDWVSVYANTNSNTSFVAMVTGVTTTSVGIDYINMLSGVTPSTSAGNMNLIKGGSWFDFKDTIDNLFGTMTINVPIIVNVQAANYDYSSVGLFLVRCNGTTNHPLIFKGYHTNPGDLDGISTSPSNRIPGTTLPLINTGGHQFFIVGGYQSYINLSFISSNGVTFQSDSYPSTFINCRFENTSNGYAFFDDNANGNVACTNCSFRTSSSAICCWVVNNCYFEGCVFESGGIGLFSSSNNNYVDNCIFHDLYQIGMSGIGPNARIKLKGNTFYNINGDAVAFTNTLIFPTIIRSNIFENISGSPFSMPFGIGSHANIGNNIYNNIGHPISGISSLDMNSLITSTEQFNNPTSRDFSLTTNAQAANSGFPMYFESMNFNSYPSIGAVMPSGGSSSITVGVSTMNLIGLSSPFVRIL